MHGQVIDDAAEDSFAHRGVGAIEWAIWVDEIRCKPGEQRGVGLLIAKEVVEGNSVDVHQGDPPKGANRTQCLEVRLGHMRGENDYLGDLCLVLPRRNKFVHDPMEGLSGERGAARGVRVRSRMDTEGYDGCAGEVE